MRKQRTSPVNRSWERTIFPSDGGSRPASLDALPSGAGTRGRLAAVVTATLCLGLLVASPARTQETDEATADEPSGDQEVEHVVKKGDTLWDLASQYLTNPFRWPDIYQLNQAKIDDPHWIYPGQRFLLPDGRTVQMVERPDRPEDETGGEAPDEEAAPDEERYASFEGRSVFDRSPERGVSVSQLEVETEKRPALVSRSDFYRVGFLAHPRDLRPLGETAHLLQENPLELELPPAIRARDEVVVRLNGMPVAPGDLLQAVRAGRWLRDRGRVYQSMGILRVSSVEGDSARAEVQQVFGGYRVGDPVIPAEHYREPASRALAPASEQIVTRVVGFEVDQHLVSTGDAIFLDAGIQDGVRLGDEFGIFSSRVSDVTSVPAEERLGAARVIRVRPTSSTARIVGLRDVGMSEGAPARLMRRVASGGG